MTKIFHLGKFILLPHRNCFKCCVDAVIVAVGVILVAAADVGDAVVVVVGVAAVAAVVILVVLSVLFKPTRWTLLKFYLPELTTASDIHRPRVVLTSDFIGGPWLRGPDV